VLTIYTLASCDTCRRAVQWLRAHGLAFAERSMRETPPTITELRRMLAGQGGELRRLCNTAGRDYREQQLGAKLPAMTEPAALALLARNGNLVHGLQRKSVGRRAVEKMSDPKPARIELRLRELAQLFNSMDPSPFIDRDLDADAEEFIVTWAREFPKDREFELCLQLAIPPQSDRAAGVNEAMHHYFSARAEMKRREFQQLMRRGRLSLVVGVLFLAGCLALGGSVAKWGKGTSAEIIEEGLTIAGWVAMWRPLEIYLYDWWPVRDEMRLLQRLARMRVELVLPPA
jgi:arsenate reductase-like glutaredoxin family protein